MYIVAVDGPSGSGKGTVSAYIAETFNFKHIDSGLLYRCGGMRAAEDGVNLENLSEANIENICQIIKNIREDEFDDPRLRFEEIASAASKIAVLPQVRDAANEWMHDVAAQLPPTYKGLIVDGRDIGTVVFPHAQVKLFVTADEETRFKRRYAQNEEAEEKIQSIITERDKRDSTRKTAPLSAATDAHIIDTTHLSLDETCKLAAQYVTNTLPVE